MYKQWLIFAVFLFALPIASRSNQALQPNGSTAARNMLPPHDERSPLAQLQATSPAVRALYHSPVAAVLAEGVADAASLR